MSVQLEIIKAYSQIIDSVEKDSLDISPVMEVTAQIVANAIDLNFRAGGRWDGNKSNITPFSGGNQKWDKLKTGEPSTLDRTKTMRRTIEVKPQGNQILVTSDSPYLAAHNYGVTFTHPGGTEFGFETKQAAERNEFRFLKKGTGYAVFGKTKPHEITIPPRPVITLTDEDLQDIVDIVTEFLGGT